MVDCWLHPHSTLYDDYDDHDHDSPPPPPPRTTLTSLSSSSSSSSASSTSSATGCLCLHSCCFLVPYIGSATWNRCVGRSIISRRGFLAIRSLSFYFDGSSSQVGDANCLIVALLGKIWSRSVESYGEEEKEHQSLELALRQLLAYEVLATSFSLLRHM